MAAITTDCGEVRNEKNYNNKTIVNTQNLIAAPPEPVSLAGRRLSGHVCRNSELLMVLLHLVYSGVSDAINRCLLSDNTILRVVPFQFCNLYRPYTIAIYDQVIQILAAVL